MSIYDSRNRLVQTEVSTDFDDVFFKIHGLGDNPVTDELDYVRNLVDPHEPSLQEIRFCKNLIKGMSAVESYRKAFEVSPETMSNAAVLTAVSRIEKRPRVAKKMYELRKMVMQLENEDLMQIIHELNEDRDLARALGQPSAAISAVKTKATILGLTNETKTTNNITVNLSDDQKKNLLSRIGHRILNHADAPIEDADFKELD